MWAKFFTATLTVKKLKEICNDMKKKKTNPNTKRHFLQRDEREMGSYLQHVSLVEAEFIALGGTERIKCHCLHADKTSHSHSHWRAHMHTPAIVLPHLFPSTRQPPLALWRQRATGKTNKQTRRKEKEKDTRRSEE